MDATSSEHPGHWIRTYEWDAKNNSYSSSNKGYGSTDTNETIILSDIAYTRSSPDSAWKKHQPEERITLPGYYPQPVVTVDHAEFTYKKIGTVACGQLACLRYDVGHPGFPNESRYILFDTTSYRLRALFFTNGIDTETITMEYTPIVISEPSPIEQ